MPKGQRNPVRAQAGYCPGGGSFAEKGRGGQADGESAACPCGSGRQLHPWLPKLKQGEFRKAFSP